MKTAPLMVTLVAAASLGACGGGGSAPPPPPSPPPPPTLSVTLSSASTDVVIAEGESASFGFVASYTGTSNSAIVADVDIGGRRYVLDGTPTASGNGFEVRLKTVPFPAGGETSTIVRFRLCTSANCSTVYPGSIQNFRVNLDVDLADWATFQRDKNHTAYVPVRYEPADFAKAWEFTDAFPDGRIRPTAAGEGTVYAMIARDGGIAYNGTARLFAFDSRNGAVKWSYDMGDQFDVGGPSLSSDSVHVSTLGYTSNGSQWVLRRDNGGFRHQMAFDAQFTDFNPPAVDESLVFVSAGYTGGKVYAYNAVSGATLWTATSNNFGVWGGQALTFDEDFIYNYRGSVLEILDRDSGGFVREIEDPAYERSGLDYEAGPVLDGNGHVFLYSGDKDFEGRNTIIAMSLATNSILWRTSAEYTTAFALKDGIIYAARQDARVVSAIDGQTGTVLWSTPMPGSDPLLGNVVVTQNLVFVSSGRQTWAIDLEQSDHPVVWEAPTGGRLAITPDNYLLTTGTRGASKLTAYRLF